MKKACLLAAWLCFGACANENPGTLPPVGGFSYPVSLALSETAGSPGILYVVSSNFALRYNSGTVIAVDLAKLAPFANPGEAVKVVSPEPGIDKNRGHVFIGSFGGKSSLHAAGGTLFVPTRSDGLLFAVKADKTTLSCWEAPEGDGQNCAPYGIPLENAEGVRVNQPFATTLLGDSLYVTHLAAVAAEGKAAAYVVQVDALNPRTMSFIRLLGKVEEGETEPVFGPPSSDIAASGEFVFVTDAFAAGESPLRAIHGETVTDLGLFEAARIYDARAIAPSSDGKRLFLATRGSRSSLLPPADGPDGLLIADFDAATLKTQVRRFIPLPKGASQLIVLPRAGRGDLVLAACLDSNLVAIFDEDLGEIADVVSEIERPYSMVVGERPGGGKRVYVAAFGSNSVDVLDLPDLTRPQDAALVGRIHAPEETR